MITPECIDRIRQRADIVHIAGELWPLTKAGSQFRACCPFHEEKSPSFHVSSSKQIYKCFGCGEAGDVFSFIQNFKRISFPEAVIYIAGRYNEPVEYEHTNPKPRSRFHNLNLR